MIKDKGQTIEQIVERDGYEAVFTLYARDAIINLLNRLSAGGGGTWGSIEGALPNQTDLQAALDAKADSSEIASLSAGIKVYLQQNFI